MSIRQRAAALAAAATVGLALLVAGPPASAHNVLISAEPGPEEELTTSPRQVELVFAEPLDPTYTVIVVHDADERPVATTDPVVDNTRGSVSFTAPLPPGTYTVAYRVTSNDGHPVQGSYTFTVVGDPADDDPDGSTGTEQDTTGGSEEETTAPDVDADQPEPAAGADGGSSTAPLLLVAGGAVLALIVGALVWRRRRTVAA